MAPETVAGHRDHGSRGAEILFATTVWPGGRSSGGEVVSQAFIDALRQAALDVRPIAYVRDDRQVGRRPAQEEGLVAARPIETSAAGLRAAPWLARSFIERQPYSVTKYLSREYAEEVERWSGAKAVILDHAQMGWLVRARRTRRVLASSRVVYLAHNIEHRLYEDQAQQTPGPRGWAYRREAKLMGRLETRLAEVADQCWTITDADAAHLRASPSGADARSFAVPSAVRGATRPPTVDIVLLGRWSWESNAIGLRWFVRDVLPRLPRGLTTKIGGDRASSIAGGRADVTVCQRVDDASDFLASGRVIAIPARAGGGAQIKTLDAIGSGRPVVATPLALRGIRDPPVTVTAAEDAEAFAAALAAAASDPPDAVQALRTAQEWAEARQRTFDRDVSEAIADVLQRSR